MLTSTVLAGDAFQSYTFVGPSGHLGVSDWSIKDAVVDSHWLSVHSYTVMSG